MIGQYCNVSLPMKKRSFLILHHRVLISKIRRKGLNEKKVKEQHQTKISDQFTTLENLNNDVDTSSA
jgi:hypothetical protein